MSAPSDTAAKRELEIFQIYVEMFSDFCDFDGETGEGRERAEAEYERRKKARRG